MYVWYLAVSLLAGFALVQRVVPDFPALVRLAAAYPVSVVVTGWVTFGGAWTAHALGHSDATRLGALVAMAADLAIVVALRHEFSLEAVRLTGPAAAGTAASLALGAWIMHARLSGDPLQVSLNTWGDTAMHVGIARSFSAGDNFPPELPLFAGEPIRYHFGFDFYAGALDRLGMPIGLAFNVPGALAFASVLMLVHSWARYLWRSRAVGVLAAALFATNGSLAFLRYFAKQDSVWDGLKPSAWWHYVGYAGGGPYNGDDISIYWTLNPYLTQTHLIVATALALAVGYGLLRHLRGQGGLPGDPRHRFAAEESPPPLPPSRAAALGALLGASFWLNGMIVLVMLVFTTALLYAYGGRLRATAVPVGAASAAGAALFVVGARSGSDGLRLAAMALVLGALALAGPLRRSLPFLVTAAVLAAPQALWLSGGGGNSFTFHTGWLVRDFDAASAASYGHLVRWWWLNLGLVLPLAVLAAVVGRRADRRLLAALMSLFLFGNLVVLGHGGEFGGLNHKVFNLWETLLNLYAAYALVWAVRTLWHRLPRAIVPLGRGLALAGGAAAGFMLFATGVLDYMTLKNDPRYEVFGDPPALAWMEKSTGRDALFLTAYADVYTTPTLAGRRVWLGGFPIWTEAMGYSTADREAEAAKIYTAPDRQTACAGLRAIGASYVQVGGSERRKELFALNEDLFRTGFVPAYSDPQVTYYDVAASCPDVPAAPEPVAAAPAG